ncbi:MAG: sigma-70 family RNA polymerase sigma factor [Isosphaeraceae bacterium]
MRSLLDAGPGGFENPSGDSGPFVADYDSLRRAARGLLSRHARDERSLGPTELVNEAVVRLLKDENVCSHPDRRYVFRAVLRTMHRILIDRSRARRRFKRGGDRTRVSLDVVLDYFEEQRVDAVELNDAIDLLSATEQRAAEVVTLRYFFRMTLPEIGRTLGVCVSTVESDLAYAIPWLHRALEGSSPPGG